MQAAGSRQQAIVKPLVGATMVVALAAVAMVPMMVWGVSCGHDYDFHAVSWMDCLAAWKHGILYPHWAATPNFGAGEPRFVFYPPLTWMLSALLGSLLPASFVMPVLMFLLLAGTGLAVRALAREALEDGPATFAGCIAICSGYVLFTGYERAAYAELTGGIWIPLLLLFMLREGRNAEKPRGYVQWIAGGSALPIALLIAASWLSNVPLGVIACYLLAATAILAALLARSWAPLVRAAVGAGLGMGLVAFYLVPAANEERWVDVRQATDDPGLLIQNSWLFARHHVPQLEVHDNELAKVSAIAVTMIAVALISALVCWMRRRFPGERTWWLPMLLIPAVVLVLQFPVSWPVWHWLPELRFLQFPWRWMVAVEAPMAILMAAVFTFRPKRGRLVLQALAGLALAGAAIAAGLLFHQECDDEESVWSLKDAQASGAGVGGYDEYAPPGADDSMMAMGLPGACMVSDPAKTLGSGAADVAPVWTPEQKTCMATAQWANGPGLDSENKALRIDVSRAGYLVLKLRRYPAWRVTVNGQASKVLDIRQDGLMTVAVPEGHVEVRADWMTTSDVVIGRWISGAFLLIVTGLGVVRRRGRVDARLKYE
jgi:hypothetical protein